MRKSPAPDVSSIEIQIEAAFKPGTFIYDRECFSFVRDLGSVSDTIAALVDSDPEHAIALYETFLAGCGAKAEELDDSSGVFGQFAADLICAWIQARQSAGFEPDATVATLLAWKDDDPYGFCHGIDKSAIEVFDAAGLTAFERQIRARFEAASVAEPVEGKLPGNQPEHVRRRLSEVLRAVYFKQGNVASYVELTAQTRLTAGDCHSLGLMNLTSGKTGEALEWVERGVDICRKKPHECASPHALTALHGDLLWRLGRGGEAVDVVWAQFLRYPGKDTYDDLMKFVPEAARAGWHEKALDAAKDAALPSLIELLIETDEPQRLADLIRMTEDEALQSVTHNATEPAAELLEKSHPDLAARLWRAQGMRIIDAKKSKFYGAAVSNFARAKRCYDQAGLAAEWGDIVRRVRAAHFRKKGFISAFERVVTGAHPEEPPSFLDQAKTQWRERYGKGTP